ncbi:MAG: hypothetical protein U1F18_06600 [Steroidobacteraceae bacterium]
MVRPATPRRVALLLGCAGLGAVGAAAAGRGQEPMAPDPVARRTAIAALAACRARLDPVEDVGFTRIVQRCPSLPAALEAGGVTALLPADWRRPRGELSAIGLDALRVALSSPAPAARRAAPDTATLEPLWRASRVASAPPGPWQRFLRWLRGVVQGADSAERDEAAWPKWLQGRSLSTRAWSLIGYLALLGLLAFLGWVLRAELIAAGWLGRTRVAASGADAATRRADDDGEAAFEAVAALERPAWLLRRVARRLQALRRLPASTALTARELARAAQLELASDRATLSALGGVAERVRFAAAPPAAAEIEPVVEAAQQWLQRLDAVTGPTDAVR